jgi:hypothetical protein
MEDCLTCDLFRKIPVDLMLEAINRFARLGSSRARLQNRIEIVLGYAVFDEASKTFRLRALARVYDEAIEKGDYKNANPSSRDNTPERKLARSKGARGLLPFRSLYMTL